jgi:hypothetical protein
MTAEDTSKKGSGTSQGAGGSDPPPPHEDAILRNLASLMRQKSDDRSGFKSMESELSEMEEVVFSGHEEIHDDGKIEQQEPHEKKTKDASAAAELRRAKRLQKSSYESTALEDSEIDVIFDEDNPGESPSVGVENEDALTAELSGDDSSDGQPPSNEASGNFILRRFTMLELAAVSLLLIVILCAAFMFSNPVRKTFMAYRQAAQPQLSVPPLSITGQFVQLEGVHSFWRNRNQDDRVQEGSRILPVISIDSAKGTGALQVTFRDEIGRIRGDIHVYRIESGASIYALGTSGMGSEVQFADHRLDAQLHSHECWTTTIKERVGEEDWVLIGKYRLSPDRR